MRRETGRVASVDVYQAVRTLSVHAYRRSARWPIGFARVGAYLGAMTTYTTPHFATGLPDRNVRSESVNRARPAPAATYRTAGVSNEAAADRRRADARLAAGRLQGRAQGRHRRARRGPGRRRRPGHRADGAVEQGHQAGHARPDRAGHGRRTPPRRRPNDSTDAAVNEMDKQAPAAGNAADDRRRDASRPRHGRRRRTGRPGACPGRDPERAAGGQRPGRPRAQARAGPGRDAARSRRSRCRARRS